MVSFQSEQRRDLAVDGVTDIEILINFRKWFVSLVAVLLQVILGALIFFACVVAYGYLLRNNALLNAVEEIRQIVINTYQSIDLL